MKRKVIVGMAVSVPILYLLFVTVVTALKLTQHHYDEQVIRQALTEEHPTVEFQSSPGYEHVSIYVVNVDDPGQQAELRDWLVRLKCDRRLKARIFVRFYHKDGGVGLEELF
jgi:hypothetical protein